MSENKELPLEIYEFIKYSFESVSFGRTPTKITQYGGSLFVRFSPTECYRISFQLYKSEVTLK